MAVGFGLFAIRRSDDDPMVSDQFLLDTPFLREFAEAVNARSDQPADSSLDWSDGFDYGDPIDPAAGYAPSDVIRGLEWLRELGQQSDPAARSQWLRTRISEPYGPEAFGQRIAHDLDGMLALCRRAQQRGDLIVGMFVP